MKKLTPEKIERLVMTLLILIAAMGGFYVASHDEKITFCKQNHSRFATVDGEEGCLVYHGEYCTDMFKGGLYPMYPGLLDIEINKSNN